MPQQLLSQPNLQGSKNEMAPQKCGAICKRRESVRFRKRKPGSRERFALTTSKADVRNVAVANVRFSPSHQQSVDLREQAREQGVGSGKGDVAISDIFTLRLCEAAMAAPTLESELMYTRYQSKGGLHSSNLASAMQHDVG
jgi:hypothetical protein